MTEKYVVFLFWGLHTDRRLKVKIDCPQPSRPFATLPERFRCCVNTHGELIIDYHGELVITCMFNGPLEQFYV